MFPSLEVLALSLLSKERAEAFNQAITEAYERPSRLVKLIKQVRMYLF